MPNIWIKAPSTSIFCAMCTKPFGTTSLFYYTEHVAGIEQLYFSMVLIAALRLVTKEVVTIHRPWN